MPGVAADIAEADEIPVAGAEMLNITCLSTQGGAVMLTTTCLYTHSLSYTAVIVRQYLRFQLQAVIFPYYVIRYYVMRARGHPEVLNPNPPPASTGGDAEMLGSMRALLGLQPGMGLAAVQELPMQSRAALALGKHAVGRCSLTLL